jgi:signal transduction histidine kinase
MSVRRLMEIIDWFIPIELRSHTATLWRARIFTISHLLGPCMAVVILSYLYRADPAPGAPFWTVAILCFAFLLLPLAMKLTRSLTFVATVSVCDLTFVSLFGSFFYGGVSSPFMPWFLTALLLGFFYMGERPLVVLGIFAFNLFGFCLAYSATWSFPNLVPVAALSTVGVVSVCAATLYTSMMAVYYANVMTAQSDLQQEVERHLVTAAKMRKAKEDADLANEAKAVFLAKMSHQLRTPLNAIIGYSEILLEETDPHDDDGNNRVSDLKMINGAGRHLLSLVSDVLYMPKIDAEKIELTVETTDLKALFDDVVSTCHSLVSQNRNELIVDVAPDVGAIECDRTKLRQIVINLLSNAGKFTSNGTVTLRARRERGPTSNEILVSVHDTGIGIDPAAIEGLFTDYTQGSARISKEFGGTGLGLALSRKFCELMDAHISVESQRGRGSTFTVRLPVTEPLAAAA